MVPQENQAKLRQRRGQSEGHRQPLAHSGARDDRGRLFILVVIEELDQEVILVSGWILEGAGNCVLIGASLDRLAGNLGQHFAFSAGVAGVKNPNYDMLDGPPIVLNSEIERHTHPLAGARWVDREGFADEMDFVVRLRVNHKNRETNDDDDDHAKKRNEPSELHNGPPDWFDTHS